MLAESARQVLFLGSFYDAAIVASAAWLYYPRFRQRHLGANVDVDMTQAS